jgi:hypothetical protein
VYLYSSLLFVYFWIMCFLSHVRHYNCICLYTLCCVCNWPCSCWLGTQIIKNWIEKCDISLYYSCVYLFWLFVLSSLHLVYSIHVSGLCIGRCVFVVFYSVYVFVESLFWMNVLFDLYIVGENPCTWHLLLNYSKLNYDKWFYSRKILSLNKLVSWSFYVFIISKSLRSAILKINQTKEK